MKKLAYFTFYLFIIIGLFSYTDTPLSGLFYQLKFILLFGSIVLLLLTHRNFIFGTTIVNSKTIIELLYIWLIVMTATLFNTFTGLLGMFYAISLITVLVFSIYLLPNTYANYNYGRLLNIILIILLSVTLLSAIYSLAGYSTVSYIDHSTMRIRYRLGFNNANYLGMISFLGLTLSAALFFKNKKFKYLIPLVVFSYFLLISDSRTALYSALIWLALFVSFNFIKKPLVQIYLFMTTVLFGLVFLNIYEVSYDNIDRLISYRLTYWSALIGSMSPIELLLGKGIGLESTDIVLGSTYDNSFISIFVQSGAVGLIVLLFILIAIFVKIIKLENLLNKKVAVSFLLSWILYSMFESSFISVSNPISLIVWVIIGVMITPARPQQSLIQQVS